MLRDVSASRFYNNLDSEINQPERTGRFRMTKNYFSDLTGFKNL
jgi:hypothetical protein